MAAESFVWIFNGEGGRFPGGVFTDFELAAKWIRENKLSGVLTKYPVDEGSMDWAIRTGRFNVSRPNNLAKSKDPSFVGSFSSASQNHVHYTDGEASGA